MTRRRSIALLGAATLTATIPLYAACNRCSDETPPSGSDPPALPRGNSAPPGAPRGAPPASPAEPAESEATEPSTIEMPQPPSLPEARPDASGPDANREIFGDYGFPGISDLTHLCGKRSVEAGGGRVAWDAFSTTVAPAVVVEHYRQWLGTRGFEAEKPGGIWRLPPGALAPTRTLRVYPPTSTGRHQVCDRQPSEDAKSLIVVTRQ